MRGPDARVGCWKWVALVLLLAVVFVVFVLGRPILHQAAAAAEYVARRACLCVFVSERSLASCLVEMPDAVARVEVEVLEEERAVHARLSFLAERTARYEPGGGCSLD